MIDQLPFSKGPALLIWTPGSHRQPTGGAVRVVREGKEHETCFPVLKQQEEEAPSVIIIKQRDRAPVLGLRACACARDRRPGGGL
jgi:hypothetical protein